MENWFVCTSQIGHRLNRITALFQRTGHRRLVTLDARQRLPAYANISLGLMLGLVPAFTGFSGPTSKCGCDPVHGAGGGRGLQPGPSVPTMSAFWWAVAGMVIGPVNLIVSFFLAFRLALATRGAGGPPLRQTFSIPAAAGATCRSAAARGEPPCRKPNQSAP